MSGIRQYAEFRSYQYSHISFAYFPKIFPIFLSKLLDCSIPEKLHTLWPEIICGKSFSWRSYWINIYFFFFILWRDQKIFMSPNYSKMQKMGCSWVSLKTMRALCMRHSGGDLMSPTMDRVWDIVTILPLRIRYISTFNNKMNLLGQNTAGFFSRVVNGLDSKSWVSGI